jgi:hypothetical protein
MSTAHPRPLKAGLAALVALATLLSLPAPAPAAEPGTTLSPARAAAGWLATELEAKEGMLTISFGGPDEFADQGLTIDAILGILAAGAGDDPAVDVALDALADPANLDPYITGFETPADRAANAVAKTLLLELVSGTDVSSAYDLEADLRAVMETTGDDVGRFSDTDSLGFGNFANGIGQALAVLALDRTAGGAPSDSVDYLLHQQCPDGSFRLYHFGTGAVDTHTCDDAAEGDPDATAFALQALLELPSSPEVSGASSGAIAYLLDQQQASGGFLGTGAVNSNTTGLAVAALRAAGEEQAADAGASFVAGLQVGTCAEMGAIAYDQSAFDAGIAADRGQWTRATAQGLLGLGLPAYGDIGSVAPATAGLAPITCPTTPGVPTAPTITLSVSRVTAGAPVSLHAAGFAPGEIVDISLHSTPISLGTLTADAEGEVDGMVMIPADVEPGAHTLLLVGRTSGTRVSAPLEVLGVTAAPGDPRAIPATGSASGGLAAVGSSLVLAGLALVGGGRRRARAAAGD